MSFEKQSSGIPKWLILLAIFIIFPKLFQLILPILIIIWVVSKLASLPKWKERLGNLQKDGFDISKFQKQKSDSTKAQKVPDPFSSSFKNSMDNFQFRPSHFFGILGIVIVIFVVVDGFYNVSPGHVAVIYDRGRGVLEAEVGEGLHIKIPFWQSVTIMDVRLQAYTMSIAASEGEVYGDDSIEGLTKDGQNVDIDLTLKYKIDAKKASQIFQEIGLDYEVKIIRPEVRSIVREVITGYESKQLFTLESRQKASLAMEEQLREQYASKNILLDSLDLRNIRFSDAYLNSIEEKQIAEQKIQKAEFERQEAEIRKAKKIIEAEADAESIRLKGESLSNNPEVIQLEFIDKMAPQINWGILPDGALPLIDVKNLQN